MSGIVFHNVQAKWERISTIPHSPMYIHTHRLRSTEHSVGHWGGVILYVYGSTADLVRWIVLNSQPSLRPGDGEN